MDMNPLQGIPKGIDKEDKQVIDGKGKKKKVVDPKDFVYIAEAARTNAKSLLKLSSIVRDLIIEVSALKKDKTEEYKVIPCESRRHAKLNSRYTD